MRTNGMHYIILLNDTLISNNLFINTFNFDKNFCSLLPGLTIANIIPIMMLGRKQSLKGEPVLADYGPEESLNESADIEWVNKVSGSTDRLGGI